MPPALRRALLASALGVTCILGGAGSSAVAAPADLDPSFGTGGTVQVDLFGRFDDAQAIALQPDGKLLVAGSTDVGNERDFAVVRLNPDGTLDPSFGGGGKRVLNAGPDYFTNGSDDSVNAMAVQPDGQILLAGSTRERSPCAGPDCTEFMAVARLNPDGSNDQGFGEAENQGRFITGFGGHALARDIAVQPDGYIVVVGDSYFNSTPGNPGSENREALVLRLTDGGEFDQTLGTQVDFGGLDRAYAVLLQPDGKIVIGGLGIGSDNLNNSDMAFARLDGSNGDLDNSFGLGNGKYTVGFGYVDFAVDLELEPDGKIVAAGRAGDEVGVTKLKDDGTIDLDYSDGGAVFEDFGGVDIGVGVELEPDGKLVLGAGTTDAALTSGDFAVGRLNTDGTPDAGFGVGGHAFVDFGGLEFASDLLLMPDSRILMAGSTGNELNADFAVSRMMGEYVPPLPPDPGTPSVDAKSLRASPRGVVPIEITCQGDSACDGSVALETARKLSLAGAAAKRKPRKRRVKLGSKRFSIPAGQTKVVRVKLKKRGFRLLKRKRKLRTRLTIRSTVQGAASTITRRTLTLKAPKQKRRRRSR